MRSAVCGPISEARFRQKAGVAISSATVAGGRWSLRVKRCPGRRAREWLATGSCSWKIVTPVSAARTHNDRLMRRCGAE